MNLEELLEQLTIIKNPADYDIVINADGLDTDASFIEFDKMNQVIRIFGE